MKIIAPLAFLDLVMASTVHATVGSITGMFGPVTRAGVAVIALDILSKKK